MPESLDDRNVNTSLWMIFGSVISAIRSAGHTEEEIRSCLNVGLASYNNERRKAHEAEAVSYSGTVKE